MAAGYNAFAVTPADNTDLQYNSASVDVRELYVGVSGDVTVVTSGGDTVLFKAVPVGFLPIRCKRVKATGTTATNIVGIL